MKPFRFLMLFCLILASDVEGTKGPVMSPVPMNVTPTTVTNTVRIVPPGGGIPSPASRPPSGSGGSRNSAEDSSFSLSQRYGWRLFRSLLRVPRRKARQP